MDVKLDALRKNKKNEKDIRRNKCIVRILLLLHGVYGSLFTWYLTAVFFYEYKFYTTYRSSCAGLNIYIWIFCFGLTSVYFLYIALLGSSFTLKHQIEMIKKNAIHTLTLSIISKITIPYFIVVGCMELTKRLQQNVYSSSEESLDELIAMKYIGSNGSIRKKSREAWIITSRGNSYELIFQYFMFITVFEVLILICIRRLNKLIMIMENENIATSNENKATSDNLTTIVAVK